jgi:hypothetical protein
MPVSAITERTKQQLVLLHRGMLTAMTLTPPAAALAAAAVPPFNTALYATAAGVIPILFLGIALQSTRYEQLTKAITKAAERALDSETWYEGFGFRALYSVYVTAACLTLVYGVAGEIAAILALANEEAGWVAIALAAGAPIILTLVIAAGPAAEYGKSAWAVATLLTTAGTASGEQQPQPPAEPGRESPGGTEPPPGTADDTPGQAGEPAPS